LRKGSYRRDLFWYQTSTVYRFHIFLTLGFYTNAHWWKTGAFQDDRDANARGAFPIAADEGAYNKLACHPVEGCIRPLNRVILRIAAILEVDHNRQAKYCTRILIDV